jgi:ribulose-bisphosphate carboxylase large chain
MSRIHATYLVETPLPVAEAAAVLGGEQSCGTFVRVPGESDALRERHLARVESIEELELVDHPALPGGKASSGQYTHARIRISWPFENVGPNLPTLVATLQGNLYELTAFTGLRLEDLDLPGEFAEPFPGPRFGIEGCRRVTQVFDRPLIGTIIKPSVGLSPDETAALVEKLIEAGIDFIKDDELMANPPHSPLTERVDAVMAVVRRQAERTGRQVMFAFNISDTHDAMHRHYDHVLKSGGTAVMLSLNSVGLCGTKSICDRGELVVHGHRNGWGMLTRHPLIGMDYAAYQKLWRLAGVDQMHVNGIANKFWESDDSVVASIESLFSPFLNGRSPMPVISSGQWGAQAPETWRRTASTDFLYQAGGGILAHPDGPAAGVRSLHLWWQAAVEGLSAPEAVEKYKDLRPSWEKFGPLS